MANVEYELKWDGVQTADDLDLPPTARVEIDETMCTMRVIVDDGDNPFSWTVSKSRS